MRGIEAAAVLGMVGGQAERKLEVLEGITEVNAFRQQNFWKHNSAHVILKKE